jgi:hypothetical protein
MENYIATGITTPDATGEYLYSPLIHDGKHYYINQSKGYYLYWDSTQTELNWTISVSLVDSPADFWQGANIIGIFNAQGDYVGPISMCKQSEQLMEFHDWSF